MSRFLATLLAFSGCAFASTPDLSRPDKAMQDIRAIEHVLDMYRNEIGGYPSEQQGLAVLLEARPGREPICRVDSFIRRLPQDPWGNEYLYTYPGKRGKVVDVWSNGADGALGGEGVDADIGNWQKGEDSIPISERYWWILGLMMFLGTSVAAGLGIWTPLAVALWPRESRETSIERQQLLKLLAYLLVATPVVLSVIVLVLSSGAVV